MPFGSQVLTRSYDETDPFLRLKTWLPAYLLIFCQKEEIPVLFRKNKHELLTCGSDVTQWFILYKMSTELCVVFQEIQVVLASYVVLTVRDIVLVLSVIVVPW